MIEAKSNNGNLSMACRGNITDLLADIAIIVHEIYCQLPETVRDDFKEIFMENTKVMFMTGEEIDAMTKQKLNEISEIVESLDELVNGDKRHEN